MKQLSPYGVDVVLDSLSGDDVSKGINLTKPMGHYVLYGAACSLQDDLPSSEKKKPAAQEQAKDQGMAASVTSQAKNSILGLSTPLTNFSGTYRPFSLHPKNAA